MNMSSSTPGIPTSETEITHISSHGIWLLTKGRELFLAYDDFPWFRDAAVGEILDVKEVSPGHFFWPQLDIDLGIESIESPGKFPLKAR